MMSCVVISVLKLTSRRLMKIKCNETPETERDSIVVIFIAVDYQYCVCLSRVHNETDAWLIISKYKKNTMKEKKRASYRSEKIMCFSLRVLVSN